MSTRRYELLSAAMLGFGHLCIMVGYDSESFVLESVIHSIHERTPEVISKYAGYYGSVCIFVGSVQTPLATLLVNSHQYFSQAVMYIVYMIGCLFSPSILNELGSKSILVCSAVCFAAFPLGFLFTNTYYYYFSQMLLGLGYALYYQGHGGYLTSHSTRKSIESNVSIAWSVGCLCLVLGAGILAGITSLTAAKEMGIQPNVTNLTQITESETQFERRFSDTEINLLFGAFFAAGVLGIVNFIVIPGKDVTNCIQETKKKGNFFDIFKVTCIALISPKMLQLLPLFTLLGVSSSFWLSIFSTAMNFTIHNSNLIYLPAVYSLGIGIGEVFMGLLITQLTRRFKDFSLQPSMTIGCVFTIISLGLVHSSTPYDAPIRPTLNEPPVFYHSYLLILILGLLIGIGDCCLNSSRSVICALAMPNKRAQAFSISKLYQAFGSCILFFLSPIIPLYVYTVGISVLCLVATVFFFSIARKTQNMEQKLTFSELEKEKEKNFQ